MKTFILTRILSLSIMILLFLIPTHAQDATQEATVPAQDVSIVGEGTDVAPPSMVCEEGATCNLNEAPETPVEVPADNSPLALLTVVATGFIGLIVAISYGLQSIGNRAQAAINNPLEIAVIEKAHESIPAPFVAAVLEPFRAALERTTQALVNVTELLKEASDKTPKASKPVATVPAEPYAVTASGVPIPSSQNVSMAGGASEGPAAFPPAGQR